jgi:hypothetical protein
VKSPISQKQREEKCVAFEITVLEGNESQDPRPKDINFFKDLEVAFVDARYNSEIESLGEEGQDDKAFEENLPHGSGGRTTCVVREEQTKKNILLGSQQTLPNMIGGGSKHINHSSGTATSKGSAYSNPLK